jgi:allantoinase
LYFITTDHSPAPPDIKEMESGNLKKAWGGIAGIQFLLTASWTALKDTISLEQFIPLVTSKPAYFIKTKKKGVIQIGSDADFVIWNPDETEMVKAEDIFFRYKISPYIAQNLNGKVLETIVNGATVYHNKSIENKNKGKWLLQK